MTITVKNLGKRYNRTVIFKNLNHNFKKGDITAITGSNGSGKSTLLRVLSSQLEPDEGELIFEVNNKPVVDVFKHLGYIAPYIDIPEEFTFNELLNFQSKFKSKIYPNSQIIDICQLSKFGNTPIKEFSSGMKQRVKLSLSLFFKNEFYLFDEPCSHLDSNGFRWFNENITDLTNKGHVIIASNNSQEIKHASQTIDIQQFK